MGRKEEKKKKPASGEKELPHQVCVRRRVQAEIDSAVYPRHMDEEGGVCVGGCVFGGGFDVLNSDFS